MVHLGSSAAAPRMVKELGKVEIILKGRQNDVIGLMATLRKKGIGCSWTKEDMDTEPQHVITRGFTVVQGSGS